MNQSPKYIQYKMKFKGKHILVTGGSSGIGEAIAKKFIKEDAAVTVFDLVEPNYNVEFTKIDIRKPNDIIRTFRNFSEFERLDVLVNNAGIFNPKRVDNTLVYELDDIYKTNFRGPFIISKYALPFLREVKGNIVNISSGLGLRANVDAHAYCAMKAALLMLTQCMAHAYGPDVRVNAVLPGSTDTPLLRKYANLEEEIKLSPLKRIISPEEIADAVLYLTSYKARGVTGALWAVDGGESSSSMYTK